MENVEQMAEAVDAAEDAAAVEQAQKEAEEAQKEAESSLDERVQQQLRQYQALLMNKWPDVDWRREDLPNELELDHNGQQDDEAAEDGLQQRTRRWGDGRTSCCRWRPDGRGCWPAEHLLAMPACARDCGPLAPRHM